MLRSYCTLPFTKLKIDADGTYHSCCYQTTKYGNILTENKSIEEIFSSNKLREVRKSVLNKTLHTSCNNSTCPFYYKELNPNIETQLSKYPIELELALHPTWCNIGGTNPTPDTACIMCPRSSPTFMRSNTYDDNLEKIIEFVNPAIPYIKYLSILGIAEPFYKGKLFEVFDKLNFKRYKSNIFFWTFSNGTVFSPKYQDMFLDEYVEESCIGFSLDAASSGTYQKIRRIDSYKVTTRNVESFFNKTRNQNKKRDWSYTTYNINLLNLKEMEDMVRFSCNIGADKVQFNTTYIPIQDIKLDRKYILNDSNWQQFWEMQQRVEQLARELNFKVEFFRPFHGGYLK